MSSFVLARRGLLGALPAAVLGQGLFARGGADALRPFARLEVVPAQGSGLRSRVEAASVQAVCAALAPGLPTSRRPLTAAELRTIVLALYPEAESLVTPAYAWIYREGQWVLWCFATATFRVDSGREGFVLIRLEEGQPLTG